MVTHGVIEASKYGKKTAFVEKCKAAKKQYSQALQRYRNSSLTALDVYQGVCEHVAALFVSQDDPLSYDALIQDEVLEEMLANDVAFNGAKSNYDRAVARCKSGNLTDLAESLGVIYRRELKRVEKKHKTEAEKVRALDDQRLLVVLKESLEVKGMYKDDSRREKTRKKRVGEKYSEVIIAERFQRAIKKYRQPGISSFEVYKLVCADVARKTATKKITSRTAYRVAISALLRYDVKSGMTNERKTLPRELSNASIDAVLDPKSHVLQEGQKEMGLLKGALEAYEFVSRANDVIVFGRCDEPTYLPMRLEAIDRGIGRDYFAINFIRRITPRNKDFKRGADITKVKRLGEANSVLPDLIKDYVGRVTYVTDSASDPDIEFIKDFGVNIVVVSPKVKFKPNRFLHREPGTKTWFLKSIEKLPRIWNDLGSTSSGYDAIIKPVVAPVENVPIPVDVAIDDDAPDDNNSDSDDDVPPPEDENIPDLDDDYAPDAALDDIKNQEAEVSI